jgi:hypothetical protein
VLLPFIRSIATKNNVISERKGKVVFLSDTYGGRVHDKAISDGEEYEFPEGSTLWQDLGFQGLMPKGVSLRQPKKKPRNQPLSDEDKQHNWEVSSERVEIEHQIGGIKRCKSAVILPSLVIGFEIISLKRMEQEDSNATIGKISKDLPRSLTL